MADRLRDQQQYEQLQNRFIGVGNPDTAKHEWRANIQRDSLASYVGHPPLLTYFSVALGEPHAVTKARFLDVSLLIYLYLSLF